MDDLTAFVRARLDEDELAARNAGGEPWDFTGINCEVRVREGGKGYGEFGRIIAYCRHGNPVADDLALAIHISNNDPARVLREVAAKRKLIEEVTLRSTRDVAEIYLATVAAVWSDHPDYPR